MPKLSVIVPATNRPATLAAVLQALRESSDPPDELIVVSESPDPSCAGAANDAALARNAGAREATGEVLVFVDADVAVHRDALARIRAAFAGDDALVALVGTYDENPPAPGFVSQYRNLRLYETHRREHGAGMFWNALGAIRRDVFEELDGFDVEFLPDQNAIQDIGLGMRLIRRGMSVTADPRIRGTHLKAWRLGQVLRTNLATETVALAMLAAEGSAGGSEQPISSHGLARAGSRIACLLTVGAIVLRRRGLALAGLGIVCMANRSLLVFLARRRGAAFATASLALIVVEELASLPAPVLARRAYAEHVGRGAGGDTGAGD